MAYWTILQMRHLISCKFRLQPLRKWLLQRQQMNLFLLFDLYFIYVLLQLTQFLGAQAKWSYTFFQCHISCHVLLSSLFSIQKHLFLMLMKT